MKELYQPIDLTDHKVSNLVLQFDWLEVVDRSLWFDDKPAYGFMSYGAVGDYTGECGVWLQWHGAVCALMYFLALSLWGAATRDGRTAPC